MTVAYASRVLDITNAISLRQRCREFPELECKLREFSDRARRALFGDGQVKLDAIHEIDKNGIFGEREQMVIYAEAGKMYVERGPARKIQLVGNLPFGYADDVVDPVFINY